MRNMWRILEETKEDEKWLSDFRIHWMILEMHDRFENRQKKYMIDFRISEKIINTCYITE